MNGLRRTQLHHCRFKKLRDKLLEEINTRFESLLEDDYFIAASVLNPRQKLRCFQSSVAPGLKKPGPEVARTTVQLLLETAIEVNAIQVTNFITPLIFGTGWRLSWG